MTGSAGPETADASTDSWGALETALRARRGSGGKCMVPYLTGGLGDDWLETICAVAAAGADAIEIGIPFSDPVMDGTTIQQANDRALSEGATPQSILTAVRGAAADIGVPTAVMTYVNIAHHMGYARFASSLAEAGVSGCILPDLPLEEVGEWAACADAAGVETVLLAAPTAPDERLPRICARSRGFVYGVGLMGITGVREELAASATAHRGPPQGGHRPAGAGGGGGGHTGPGSRSVRGGRRGGGRLGHRHKNAGGRRTGGCGRPGGRLPRRPRRGSQLIL